MANTVIIVGALAIIAAFSAGWALNSLIQRTGNLEAEVLQLKAAQAKHLPYMTADEIENSIAAMLYVKQANDLRGDMIDNAIAHMQKARNPKK